ncbi:Copper chaperone for superoxide dismutase chloroplastic/cytosolic [Zea mays]|uniref:Copper chaperone for superoxide dismutase chloroplastic/cytosolic n=1 Tax=Zea mays TaxID=4577 RepID=A0A1D6JC24_MAIZE|nr:Copper chaperone for superoxide dismutase chloroplastic/cytosolic [Zea mays]
MVDMKCEGCVTAVKNKLQTLEGIKNIEVDLSNQVVRVLGSRPVKIMLDVLYQTGREARLIGQGNPNAKDKSDPGIAAAVIARSAGVGENYKELCTCDGVTIWESS